MSGLQALCRGQAACRAFRHGCLDGFAIAWGDVGDLHNLLCLHDRLGRGPEIGKRFSSPCERVPDPAEFAFDRGSHRVLELLEPMSGRVIEVLLAKNALRPVPDTGTIGGKDSAEAKGAERDLLFSPFSKVQPAILIGGACLFMLSETFRPFIQERF